MAEIPITAIAARRPEVRLIRDPCHPSAAPTAREVGAVDVLMISIDRALPNEVVINGVKYLPDRLV